MFYYLLIIISVANFICTYILVISYVAQLRMPGIQGFHVH